MDKKQAHLVELEGSDTRIKTLESGLEFYNPKGGSRSKTRWGPQQVVHDSTYTEREKHQLRDYFQRVADALGPGEAVVLFGPGGTNAQFKAFLDERFPHIAARVRDVLTADSMTLNQVGALVREYFAD